MSEVIVGYTTESGHSAGRYGIFEQLPFAAKLGINNSGTVQLDKVRDASSLGHAFELRQAINRQPKVGAKGASERRLFLSRWEPTKIRDDSWKKVAAASAV